MNYLKRTALGISVLTVLLTGCKKDNEREILLTQEITGVKGIYILNEGTWNGKNASISYYDVAKKTVVKDFYKQANAKDLGNNAIDLKQYGSKLYCVVSGETGKADSFVDIMDINTGKTLKRIAFNATNESYLPRSIAFYKNKAYVSRYDGKISRIDTTSLNIDGELQLKNGADNAAGLEGVAVANGKLYVAGSDHVSYPTSLKNKVVVIDLATFTKAKDITVNANPIKVAANDKGELLVLSAGVYGSVQSAVQKINTSTDVISQTESADDFASIAIYNDQVWTALEVYGGSPKIKSFNIATGKVGANLITDGTAVAKPYGLTVNPYNQNVVVSDAISYAGVSGTAFIFNKEGKKQYEFETGINPQAAAFVYTYKYVYKSL
ncbi:DUF5074 domain-containing protein [Pedobacter chitinilyticus]|uniref:DUF5074 domain-containing protein n=1 Tax=Pedobacter chitinilyticus TaxID=2233776 RepID=A0A3S3PDA0_9SPHI|nr:DUF5074 domain-containing protein [Pedobacter chitinilyticus]RWU10236.1 hypothetical protein DPV69_02510 [Pedobacter chitinilyticus]